MASPGTQTSTCSEGGCIAQVHAKGLCQRCYSAAYYRANRSRLLQAARDRMPPAIVRPFTITVGCVSCGHRFTVPAVGVVACPQCHRLLQPVLEISDRRCPRCGGPVAAGADQRAAYCSARCRVAAKEARRPRRIGRGAAGVDLRQSAASPQ